MSSAMVVDLVRQYFHLEKKYTVIVAYLHIKLGIRIRYICMFTSGNTV